MSPSKITIKELGVAIGSTEVHTLGSHLFFILQTKIERVLQRMNQV